MEICKYQNKEVCSYDLKDDCGIYQHEKVIELKRAAARGQLFCADCGKRVYLAAGLIREPYFAHYDAKDCVYAGSVESEESRLAKRLIYHMLKRSFSEEQIAIRHRLEDGTYATFLVHNLKQSDLAIDYRLTQLPIKILDKRVRFLKEHQICSMFILSDRQNREQNQLTWYQEYMQKMIGYCVFLRLTDQTLLLKRSFHYQNQTYHINRVFEYQIPAQQAVMDDQGRFKCDFIKDCTRKEQELIAQIENRIQAEDKEKKRQLEYRIQQMQKEEQEEQMEQKRILHQIIQRIDVERLPLPQGIRKDILLHCIDMIQNGDIDLISRKYREFLLSLKYEI